MVESAEDLSAHCPEFDGSHFQSNHEQEHHDPELGEMEDRMGVGEQAQYRGAHQKSGSEITENRAKTKAAEQGNRDHRRSHQNDRRSDHFSKACVSHRCLARFVRCP